MRTIVEEPYTVAEAQDIIRDMELPEARVKDLISGAREAAENYVNDYIAKSTVDDSGEDVTVGYAAADVPPSIKLALNYHMICSHEAALPAEWLPSFYTLLAPWRQPPCS